MKLFYSVNSPYARKARIVAREKNLINEIQEIAVNSLENPPELLAVNPLAKIPALQLADGKALCESPVICEYLDSLNNKPSLIPAQGQERWDVLGQAALADGIMDAAVALVVEGRKPESQRSPEWHKRYHTAIERTLKVLAQHVPTEKDPLDMGGINMAVALGYISFRHPNLNWRTSHPTLASWFDGFSQRPSMQATLPQA